MNEYAKEGKQFLHIVKEYFDEYEKTVGGSNNLFCRFSWDTSAMMPCPNKLISCMSHIKCPDGYVVPLTKCGIPGFDGFFVIGDEKEGLRDTEFLVFNSMLGVWELTMLAVLSKHIMPLYWHANYMRWLPIFDDRSLRNLRNSHEKYSDDYSDTYSFIPDNLPTGPTIECLDNSTKYKVTLYVWSDFGGYLAVITTITMPEGEKYVKVREVDITTDIKTIYKYRCGIMF